MLAGEANGGIILPWRSPSDSGLRRGAEGLAGRRCGGGAARAHSVGRRARDARGPAKPRSHFRCVLPVIHFIPHSLTYSVLRLLKRQCDRTLGPARPRRRAGRIGARVISAVASLSVTCTETDESSIYELDRSSESLIRASPRSLLDCRRRRRHSPFGGASTRSWGT